MDHPPFITHPAFSFPEMRYGFFTREGGVSTGVYASLNCNMTSGDAPAHAVENRRRVAVEMDADPAALLTCRQTHSARAVYVEKPWLFDDRPEADAMVTGKSGLALGILTADCGPVLFYDQGAHVIGAAHAGWKGAVTGILEETVTAMQARGAQAKNIHAVIGPCIRQPSYEVGPEFPAPFLQQDEGNGVFFKPAFKPSHFLFDLPGYLRQRLEKAGVAQIHMVGLDTYSDEKRFFSYRRATHRKEKGNGTLMSVIVLE